ncbi:lycopene cyclase domain-containing protein [candidate division KSB1 bacterium]|nr:lycopene cyclase domain-containing protein [candidate division KSB1 bacterium]RQW03826.1 MAG: lycopene cyclase domain-containing protein [candidate division KSB1 bacterium]
MKIEYLLFNLLIISGPIALSFDSRVRYIRNWGKAALASLLSLVPFIMWDSLVTGRHWWFNHAYTLNIRILGLPIGEWLFFFTVPFACLFIWEIITYFRPRRNILLFAKLRLLWLLVIPVGMWLFFTGLEYTGAVLIALSIVSLLDKLTKTNIIVDARYYIILGILIGLMLVFNGYLTARPLVLYDSSYQLDIRIITIPVEDFLYGISHILLTLIVYTKIKERRRD